MNFVNSWTEVLVNIWLLLDFAFIFFLWVEVRYANIKAAEVGIMEQMSFLKKTIIVINNKNQKKSLTISAPK